MSHQVFSKHVSFLRKALISPASVLRTFGSFSSTIFCEKRIPGLDTSSCASCIENPTGNSVKTRTLFTLPATKRSAADSRVSNGDSVKNRTLFILPTKKRSAADSRVSDGDSVKNRTLFILPARKRSAADSRVSDGDSVKNRTFVLPTRKRSAADNGVSDGATVSSSRPLQPLNPFSHCQPQPFWTRIGVSRALHSAIGDDDNEDESDDVDDFLFDSEVPKGKGRSSLSVNGKGVRSPLKRSESEDDDDVPIFATRKRKPSAIAACEDSDSEDSDDDEIFDTILSKKQKTLSTKIHEDSDSDRDEVCASRERNPAISNGKSRRPSSDSSVTESKARFAKRRPAALENLFEERSNNAGRGKSDSSLMANSPSGEDDKDVRPLDESSSTTPVSKEGSCGPSYLTNTRFDKFPISPLSVKALHSVLKYERMTEVQEATLPVILKGQDVLAKARTGTGKTIAFLLPAIEAILKASAGRSRNPVHVLIVCPTRELAQQAAMEAKVLLQFHRGVGAQVVYGGCSIRGEQMNLSRSPCQILVGTPGRLVDHIQRTPEMARQLKSVQLFVLDEADHMLDMGFRDSLQKIMDAIPSKRQTLLFSATIPKEVHSMAKIALKNDHVFIDAVGKDSQDTHTKVKQQYIVVPLEKQIRVIYASLQQHMEADSHYKVLVFCSTARTTAFMCKLFMNLGFNAREIHSRKDQSYRTRVSDEFRHSKGGIILFTSDVSARGVDYPNVTLVVQVGAPSEFEQYIHRLGRTGRAGKKGEGLLILAPWEDYFLQKLTKLPITALPPPKLSSQAKSKILSAASLVDESLKEMAYTAWLGYYRSLKGLSLDKAMLVEYANQFSVSMGLDEPPALSRMIASKMALNGVPGIRLRR